MSRYILSVDQSTQGTKGLLFDENGILTARVDRPHRQIVNDKGWVEHDPIEILENTLAVCGGVLAKAGVNPAEVATISISNQRETVLMWDKATGKPVYNAIVWQCARAAEICERQEIAGKAEENPSENRNSSFSLLPRCEADVADGECAGSEITR